MMPSPHSRRPAWLILLLVVMALPLLVSPVLLSRLPEDDGILMGFPLYVMLTIYLAYASWPMRKYVSWILIGVLALSYVSLLILLI